MTRSRRRRQHGLTLPELMIATSLTLMIMAAVSTVYGSGRTAIRLVEQQLGRQQDINHALALLERDLRRAGTFGCASARRAALYGAAPQAGLQVRPADAGDWLHGTALRASGPALEISYGGEAASPTQLYSAQPERPWLEQLEVENTAALATARRLALASCDRVDLIEAQPERNGKLLRVKLPHAVPLHASDHDVGHHADSLTLSPWHTRVYLVARHNERSALYLIETLPDGRRAAPQEVADGINGLELEYGQCAQAGAAVHFSRRLDDWRELALLRVTLSSSADSAEQPGYSVVAAPYGGRPCDASAG